ncbi:hypothetical protein [uncultured Alistipes sp.]|uniref:hypothetical protein n=1 Tax=uncultured Alistipes sp. TaxID=538949 RepID=UPI0025D9BE6A|nr:hypothetical protein [uncultured Alistipes sp.]
MEVKFIFGDGERTFADSAEVFSDRISQGLCINGRRGDVFREGMKKTNLRHGAASSKSTGNLCRVTPKNKRKRLKDVSSSVTPTGLKPVTF